MCGFFGQYNTSNLPSTEFKSLLAMSTHRGPDQTGVWEGERVQLGFNRLAILDLTQAGHQPMQSPTGQFVVVFNGEIYNHQHLRKTLPAHNYRGHSDTETVTCALEVWDIRKTLKQREVEFKVLIQGGGWDSAKDFFRKHGIDFKHRQITKGAEIVRFLAHVHVYLCTSDFEGGPLPVLESLACGVPVVSTRVGMARDVLEQGGGILCNKQM